MDRITIPAKPRKLLSCGICLGLLLFVAIACELWSYLGLKQQAARLEEQVTAFEQRQTERLFPDLHVAEGNASHDYAALSWVLGWNPDLGDTPPVWLPETELPQNYQGSSLEPLREVVASLEPGAPLEPEVEALLSEYGSLLKHVEQGVRRTECRWDIADLRHGSATKIPNLVAARQVSELLFLEAHRADPEECLRLGRLLLAFGRDIALVPNSIAMQGFQIEEFGIECLRRRLPELSADALRALCKELLACPPPDAGYTLEADRLVILAWVAQLAGQPLADGAESMEDDFGLGVLSWSNVWMQLEWNEVELGFEKWQASLDQPRSARKALRSEAQAWLQTCWGSLSAELLSDGTALLDVAAAAQARQGCLALLAASELYVREHEGGWPASLGALLPYLDDELPSDPFATDGGPLRLIARDGELVAYSVGADGVDDGAKIAHSDEGESPDIGLALLQP